MSGHVRVKLEDSGRSVPASRDDREREWDPPPLFRPNVAVAAPPVERMLRDLFEPQPGAQQRGDDFAEGPGSRELPALVVLVDRRLVDVLGRPALRGFGAPEV